MRRFLFLIFLLVSLPALAQKPPVNGVAGPTTSSQFRSIITNPNGDGQVLFSTGDGSLLNNISSLATNYLAPFSNSVSRTQNSKDSDLVSPLDFGGTCNGTADDTTALQRAAATGRSVMLPALSCRLTGIMSFVTAGQCLYGQGQDISNIKMSGTAQVSFSGGADGGCGSGFTLDGQNLMSAGSVLLDINHRSNLNFSFFALRNADTAIHIYGSSLRIRFSHFLFRGAGSAGSIRQVWLNGISDADRVQNVNFDNGDMAPLRGGTSMVVADGSADSIVFNNVGFSATTSLPAKYGIWATKNDSYTGTVYPSFIKYWGRGMENLVGSPLRFDGGSHFWVQNTYLSADGEDDGLYFGSAVLDDILITGNTIRGNGRNGINVVAGRGVISANLIVNNGGNSGAAFPAVITSATNNGGVYQITYTPNFHPLSGGWQARNNDIIVIAGVTGGTANGTWYISCPYVSGGDGTCTDTTRFDLANSTYTSDGTGGTATMLASGIRVGAAVNELQVSSNVIGRMLGGINRQAYGTWIETGATNVTVRNNWMRFNTVAPINYAYADKSVLIDFNGGDDDQAVGVVSTAGTTVLTGGSKPTQILTGTTTQTFQLPVGSTLVLGTTYSFINNSTADLTITNNSGTTIGVVPAGGRSSVTATSVITTNGSWSFNSRLPSNVTWGTGGITQNSGSISGLTVTQSGGAPVLTLNNNTGLNPSVLSGAGLWWIGNSATIIQNGSSLNHFQVSGLTQAASAIAQSSWVTASASAPVHIMSRSRGTTIGTHSAVVSGNLLGTLGWEGSDGTGFISAASIRAEVDGTPGTNDMPTRLIFATTADGAATPTDRLTIDNTGLVTVAGSMSAPRATITSNIGIITTNQVSGAAAATGTLLNAPGAGDPTFWLPVSINGVTRYVPAW